MATHNNPSVSPISWLLLRDGHAVPIFGFAPEDLKRSRAETIERPGLDLGHVTGLNAILDCLGFDGDFGRYKRVHWPRLQALLEKHGCTERVDLFNRGMYLDLAFRVSQRALADRYFLGPTPRPTQVFLGTVDHFERFTTAELRNTNFTGEPPRLPDDASFAELREAVFANRIALHAYWNVLGDQLVRPMTRPFVAQSYFTKDTVSGERERTLERDQATVALFRRAIEMGTEGWVEIAPVTDRLAFLRAANGQYSFIWSALREGPPSKPVAEQSFVDLPSLERERRFGLEALYFDQTIWAELDQHEAELLHCRSGGHAGPDYPGSDELLRRYYESQQPRAAKRAQVATAGSLRLTYVEVAGKVLGVSELVTIGEFFGFMEESGYAARRSGENIARANADDDPALPACCTFDDALAYCAHLEGKMGVAVRLLTYTEHRALRPNFDEERTRIERRARVNEAPSAVWPTAVQFDPGALDERGGLKWVEDYPPKARWSTPLPWATHSGLRFLDAWDAAEWTLSRDHNAAVTVQWEGDLPNDSWGAYKQLKTCFRVAVELEGGAR